MFYNNLDGLNRSDFENSPPTLSPLKLFNFFIFS